MRSHFKKSLAFGLGLAALALTAAAAPVATAPKAPKAKIGAAAPAWKATDLAGKEITSDKFKGKIVVLEWTNPSCPYIVGNYDAGVVKNTIDELKKLDKDIVYLGVNSTAIKSKENVITENTAFLAKHKLDFPVVVDYDGTIGKAYGAKTTPHVFVIDGKGVLRYQGAFTNDKRFEKTDRTNYVLNAVKQIKAGETVSPDSEKPWGCSVKYAKKSKK